MKALTLTFLAAAAMSFLSHPALAVDTDFFFGANISGGASDPVIDQTLGGEHYKLRSGEGLHLFLGASFELVSEETYALDLDASIGIKMADTTTFHSEKEGEVTFSRFPLEALLFYRSKPFNFRVGGGLSYHMAGSIEGDGDVIVGDVDIENALGYVVQLDYLFGPDSDFAVGLKYQVIDYEVEDTNQDFDADNLGVGFTYYFR